MFSQMKIIWFDIVLNEGTNETILFPSDSSTVAIDMKFT